MVWVTGAAGMLGQAVVETLRRWDLPHVGTGREVDITEATAVGEMMAARAPTHVINCAAYTAVDDAESAEDLARRVNALGPENLGRAAARTGARVVHFSTDYVFSGEQARAYREEDAPAPVNAYGRSKLEGERRLAAACPSSLVVRASWLFGPGGPNFAATVLEAMATRVRLQIVDDQHGRPTYARDLAQASLCLAGLGPRATAPAATGLIHFANAGETTWHGVATRVHATALRLGLPIAAREVVAVSTDAMPRPARRPPRAVLDTTRFERAVGWSPRAWTAALDAYLEHEREERDERAS